MLTISDVLRAHPLVIVKLGAGGDDYSFIPPIIRRHTILVCLDAGGQSIRTVRTPDDFRQRILVTRAVAPTSAPRVFIERAWWGCSSLLEAKAHLVEKYGQQSYCQERSRVDVQPVTVPEILAANGLSAFDALVTDLEGLDFDVVRSCEALLLRATLIQSELRFEPFYDGEPYLHEVVGYLSRHGLQLIGIKPEYWKPVSRDRDRFADGVAVWADCLFFRNRDALSVRGSAGDDDVVALTKSIVLLALFGKGSLAAHLYEKHRAESSGSLPLELEDVIRAKARYNHTANPVRLLRPGMRRLKHFARFVRRTKRWSWSEASRSYFDFPHVARPGDQR